MIPISATTKRIAASTPKVALVEGERTGASFRRFQPFVGEHKRGDAVEGAPGNPHDETGEPLVVDRIEADAGHAHCRVIGIPGARREAHQGAQRATDQGSGEQAGGGDTKASRASARMEHRPPEQQRAYEETGVLRDMPAEAVE